jgi:uncharacterized protein (DUF58 family)
MASAAPPPVQGREAAAQRAASGARSEAKPSGVPERPAEHRRAPAKQSELLRAARVLTLRSRLEATGLFAGNYRSAFRGGGLEYEESRPYAPGDDVRALDASATARTGTPYVKIFREERDRSLLLGLDVSGSMSFGTAANSKAAERPRSEAQPSEGGLLQGKAAERPRSEAQPSEGGLLQGKAATAAHALALLASAAGRAGDRIGLVAFDSQVREEAPLARGRAQSARLIRLAAQAASESRGPTDLAAGLRALRRRALRRAVIVLISDFRDPALEAGDSGPLRRELSALARENDVVAAVVVDPREQALVAAGGVRVRDVERGGRALVLSTGSARARRAYAAEAERRRAQLARDLRSAGADCLWLRSDRSPFFPLARFFQERAGRRLGGAR